MTPFRRTVPLLLAFGHLGLLMGIWGASIATIKDHADLSARGLGIALIFLPLGTLVGLPLSRRLLKGARHGTVLAVATPVSTAIVIFLLDTSQAPVVAALLFLAGVAMCQLNVAANHYGARLEAQEGRPLMSGLHAPFGYGSAVGAGLAYLAQVRDSQAIVLAAELAALTVPVIVACARLGALPPPKETNKHPRTPGSRVGGRHASLTLGAISMIAAVAEGGFSDWIGVYLHLRVGTSTAIAAVGFAVFAAALTIGRTFGDRLTAAIGAIRMVRLSSATAVTGIVIVLVSPTVGVAMPGIVIAGLGLSSVSPRILAAAGQDGDGEARSLTKVIGLSTVGSFAGPPILGTTSSILGLPAALAIQAGLIAVVGGFAPAVNGHQPSVSLRDGAGSARH